MIPHTCSTRKRSHRSADFPQEVRAVLDSALVHERPSFASIRRLVAGLGRPRLRHDGDWNGPVTCHVPPRPRGSPPSPLLLRFFALFSLASPPLPLAPPSFVVLGLHFSPLTRREGEEEASHLTAISQRPSRTSFGRSSFRGTQRLPRPRTPLHVRPTHRSSDFANESNAWNMIVDLSFHCKVGSILREFWSWNGAKAILGTCQFSMLLAPVRLAFARAGVITTVS